MVFEYWVLSQLFHSPLSTFIKRLFSSSSLFAMRVVLSSYLRLLIFLLATLIPPFDSLSPAFSMMYSAQRASLVAQLLENPLAMQEDLGLFPSWVGKIPWRRHRLPAPVFLGSPCGSDGKESVCNVGDLGLLPGLGRSPGGGHGNPLHFSCLENPHGQSCLVVYSPWTFKESDTTDGLSISQDSSSIILTIVTHRLKTIISFKNIFLLKKLLKYSCCAMLLVSAKCIA